MAMWQGRESLSLKVNCGGPAERKECPGVLANSQGQSLAILVSFFTSGYMSSTFILTPTPHISDTGSHRQQQSHYSDTDGSDDDILPTSPRILCNRDDHSPYSAGDKIQDRKSRKAASQRRYYQKYGLCHLSNIFADVYRLGTRPDIKRVLEFEQLQCKRHRTRPSILH